MKWTLTLFKYTNSVKLQIDDYLYYINCSDINTAKLVYGKINIALNNNDDYLKIIENLS